MLFFRLNPPLSLVVYSLAKIIQYFEQVSYTLSFIQNRAESKNSGHPIFNSLDLFQIMHATFSSF